MAEAAGKAWERSGRLAWPSAQAHGADAVLNAAAAPAPGAKQDRRPRTGAGRPLEAANDPGAPGEVLAAAGSGHSAARPLARWLRFGRSNPCGAPGRHVPRTAAADPRPAHETAAASEGRFAAAAPAGPGRSAVFRAGTERDRAPRGHLSVLWRGTARKIASPLSPREACFAFGLANMRPGSRARRDADPRLAARLAEAVPPDCLDAAFALMSPRPSDVIDARAGHPVPRPFRDVDYFAAIARWLGCAFDNGPVVAALARRTAGTLVEQDGGAVIRFGETLAIAPVAAWLPRLAALLARSPDARRRVLIVPPQTIAAAAAAAAATGGPHVATGRLDPLHDVPSAELADRVITRPQAISFTLLVIGLAVAGTIAPGAALGLGVATMSVILVGYAASRGAALVLRQPPPPPTRPLRTAELPEYSVLLPLYKEDEGLAHLVRALRRIDYPPEKLDIQFLVEADDRVTQRAVAREAHALACRMTVVPAGLPRTKPRALNVGLRQARGSLVTIFDAEDRPDPGQLRLAAETFAAAPPNVAALQARLSIDHLGDNWLTKMFAIEYAALFDHVMPMLAGAGRIVLLGGTSNHFRGLM